MQIRVLNFFRLIGIFRERANWPLIRRSRHELSDFVLCRSGIRRKSLIYAAFHWFYLLKGLELLVWRLETFGILFPSERSQEERQQLNRLL
jgi:hypothetical protein